MLNEPVSAYTNDNNIRYSTQEGWGHYLLRDVTKEELKDFWSRVPARAVYEETYKDNGLIEIYFCGIDPELEPHDDVYAHEADPCDPDYMAEMYELMLTIRSEENLECEYQKECAE